MKTLMEYLLINFFTISIIVFSGCKNSSEPVSSQETNQGFLFSLDGDTALYTFTSNPDSIKTEPHPNVQIYYDSLQNIGIEALEVEYGFPNSFPSMSVINEIKVGSRDSFEVNIINCQPDKKWNAKLGNFDWKDSSVILNKIDTAGASDSKINYKFRFITQGKSKGYIGFYEENSDGSVSSNAKGVIAGYTMDPLENIWIDIKNIKWIYDTRKNVFSSVSIAVRGQTNAYRMRIMTYGDGVSFAREIPINNGSFSDTIGLAFSNESGLVLTVSTEMALYGTSGLPKLIPLVNPKK